MNIKNKFDEILHKEIFIGSSIKDLKKEIEINTEHVSFYNEDESITVEEIINYLEKVRNKIKKEVHKSSSLHGVFFYVWFDEIAAQLRMSIISETYNKLPFSCRIKLVESLEEIVKDFIKSKKNYIPWKEFSDDSHSIQHQLEESDEYTLKVYNTKIQKIKLV